jgi:hypothetical protein
LGSERHRQYLWHIQRTDGLRRLGFANGKDATLAREGREHGQATRFEVDCGPRESQQLAGAKTEHEAGHDCTFETFANGGSQ